MSEMQEVFENLKTVKEIWDGRNLALWYVGLFLLVIGLLLRKIKTFEKRQILQRLIRIMPFVGLICILLCFAVGSGLGIGIGNGSGVGIGSDTSAASKSDLDESPNDSPVSLDAAIEQVRDRNELLIRIDYNDIYVGDWLCDEHSDIEEVIEEMYKDGMVVVLEDQHAYYKPYVEVETLLQDRQINYTKIDYEGEEHE